jgi:uncharacterized protein
VHLGKLATLLRLAGFDAVIEADDAALAAYGMPAGRVVLTRDVGLLKRAVVQHGYWVRHVEPERQLAEVLERFSLIDRMQPFIRCLRCNGILTEAHAAAVADRVPPRTRECIHEFRECPGCRRVYWKGSHYDRLLRLIERARSTWMSR